jgi:hypothetical protein
MDNYTKTGWKLSHNILSAVDNSNDKIFEIKPTFISEKKLVEVSNNMKLIQKAPEMYKLLENILLDIDGGEDLNSVANYYVYEIDKLLKE